MALLSEPGAREATEVEAEASGLGTLTGQHQQLGIDGEVWDKRLVTRGQVFHIMRMIHNPVNSYFTSFG